MVTKVTWFFRGLGRLGGTQLSTVPLMLRSSVEERMSDPFEPPVRRTMFIKGSMTEELIVIKIFLYTFHQKSNFGILCVPNMVKWGIPERIL